MYPLYEEKFNNDEEHIMINATKLQSIHGRRKLCHYIQQLNTSECIFFHSFYYTQPSLNVKYLDFLQIYTCHMPIVE